MAATLLALLLLAAPAGVARAEEPHPGEGVAEAVGGPDGHAQEHGAGHGGTHIDNWFSLSYGPGKERHNAPLGWAIINFAILCYLLFRFTRKPIRSYLVTRHAQVQKDLVEAAELRENARRKLEEIDAKLEAFDAEVAAIKANVKKDAEAERDRIIQNARDEAERLVRQAEKTLERELRRARHTLEVEAVDRALKVAEERIRKGINDADRKRINDEYIARIASSGGAN